MKKNFDDQLEPEYDLHQLTLVAKGPGRSGKGTTILLAPDVARVFPDAKSVNEALRTLIRLRQLPAK